jgi:hypothetical protein
MEAYINGLFTAVLILGIIIIYRKSDSCENLLFLKLLGYYLLGSFRFNLNKLAIPLGFILYLIFFKPKLNEKNKRSAALLGLLFFILGVAIPLVSNFLYEMPKQIKVDSVRINTIDFQKDWQLIKQKLEVNEDTRLEEFNLSYNADGTIRDLSLQLILRKDKEFTHYFIYFSPDKKKYIIRPSKVERWLQYDRLVTAERYFQYMSLLDLEAIRPSKQYEWYVVASMGEVVNYAIRDNNKFLVVSKDNLRKISNDELPIKGFYISSYGMEEKSQSTDHTSYESSERTDYFFDVTKN